MYLYRLSILLLSCEVWAMIMIVWVVRFIWCYYCQYRGLRNVTRNRKKSNQMDSQLIDVSINDLYTNWIDISALVITYSPVSSGITRNVFSANLPHPIWQAKIAQRIDFISQLRYHFILHCCYLTLFRYHIKITPTPISFSFSVCWPWSVGHVGSLTKKN